MNENFILTNEIRTVAGILQDMYSITQSTIRDKETGEPIETDDLQDMFYQDIEQLAELLGVELKG
ncbi:hypothetical protein [Aerococcus urinaeequi]|uniref:hypothetical protein n=1 Tax=Aerococcus urinaeequi TaxID=51665 RepID=UPI003AC4FAD5